MTAPANVGLYRKATAAALVLGPLLFLVDNLLHPKEYFIVSSAVWLAGGVAVAASVARMSDARFAGAEIAEGRPS